MIEGFMRLTLFHTEYGIPSGPGAEEGEDLERASLISSSPKSPAPRVPLYRRSSLNPSPTQLIPSHHATHDS